MISGISDHGGWRSKAAARSGFCRGDTASSVMSSAPAPAPTQRAASATCSTIAAFTPAFRSTAWMFFASAPMEASTTTTSAVSALAPISGGFEHSLSAAAERRHTGQHALELLQRSAHVQALSTEAELANGILMRSDALFDDRHRL